MSPALDSGRREALKSIFAWLLAADIGDEDRWVQFIHVLNESGRFIMGFPHLESSESDIFGALDDIAGELDATKTAIQQTTREARIAQGELHKALEPLLPDEGAANDEGPRLEDRPGETHVSVEHRSSGVERRPAPNPTAEAAAAHVDADPLPVAVPSPGREAPARVGRGAETPAAGIEPVRPTPEDERFFTAIRKLGNEATYDAVAEEAGTYSAKLYQRLSLLAKYDTLPADIAAWRAYRSTRRGAGALPPKDNHAAEEQRVRDAAAAILRREATVMSKNVAELDEFAARRKANAAVKANEAWEARTKGSA